MARVTAASVMLALASRGAPAWGQTQQSCSPQGDSLAISAQDSRFDKDCLAAPARTPFTIVFDNRDPLPHNIVIHRHGAEREPLYRADLFTGPKTATFSVGRLPAGTYHFHCEVHPTTMTGTFVVAATSGDPPPMVMDHNRHASDAAPAEAGSERTLARTGSAHRLLLPLVGLLLVAGGSAVAAGSQRGSR